MGLHIFPEIKRVPDPVVETECIQHNKAMWTPLARRWEITDGQWKRLGAKSIDPTIVVVAASTTPIKARGGGVAKTWRCVGVVIREEEIDRGGAHE